jgi:hypothetical protein
MEIAANVSLALTNSIGIGTLTNIAPDLFQFAS